APPGNAGLPAPVALPRLLTEYVRRLHHVAEAGPCLVPSPGLQSAVRVDPQAVRAETLDRGPDLVGHLLGGRHSRRVDVPHAGTNPADVAVGAKVVEQPHARPGAPEQGDVCIEVIDGLDDVAELRVADVG